MKFSSLKKIVAASLLLAASAPQAQARFELPNFMKRWELGYSYSMAFANYKSTELAKNPHNNDVYTINIDRNVRSSFGYGGFTGTYIPVAKMGNSTLLAVGVNMAYNAFLWDYVTPSFQSWKTDVDGNIIGANFEESLNGLGFGGVSIQMAVPVSLDLKFGAEATLEKGAKWTGTFGVGAYPSGAMTADFGNAGFGFGVSPFVKGEIGVKGGILWKLRVQYAMGNIPFYTENKSVNADLGFSNNSELIGRGVFSASLVLMPFSWNFQEDGWWNWHR